MLNLHFYLDIREIEDGQTAPLKLAVTKHSRTGYLGTGIRLRPCEWDARNQKVIDHPRKKVLNSDLSRLRAEAEDYLRPLLYNGELAELSATRIKDLLKTHFYGQISALKLRDIYQPFIAKKSGGTASIYAQSWQRLHRWCESFGDTPVRAVTAPFVAELNGWLTANFKPNTVATTFRLLVAIWNDAVRAGKVSGNPFAGISTAQARTAGRDLTLEQMRRFWRAETKDEYEAEALDFFKLSFLLRAINPIDLLRVRLSDITNGRLYYNRQKTGKAISVKIEPEADAIIAKRTDGVRLFSMRSSTNYGNVALRRIATREGLPPVTCYWARHTLASLLFEQGGTMDIVSAILSHSLGGARVTSTYVAVREARLDDAMRSVIDAVVN